MSRHHLTEETHLSAQLQYEHRLHLIAKRVLCYVPALALSFLNVELGIAARQSSRCYFIKKAQIYLLNKQAKKNASSKRISPHCGVRFLNVELGIAARQSSRCY